MENLSPCRSNARFARAPAQGSRAFTLIELLMYTGILVLLVAVIGSTLLAFARTQSSIVAEQALEGGAQTALGRIVREARSATRIDAAASVFNVSPGTLTIDTADASGTAETLKFFPVGASVHLARNGVDLGPLSPAAVSITNLVFRHITTARSEGVKIELTLESGTGAARLSRNFYDTAIARGTYVQ